MSAPPKLDTMGIGRRLESVRRLRGLTQDELAERAKVARTTVVRAEAGRLSILTISRLASTLCTSLDYIVEGKGAP